MDSSVLQPAFLRMAYSQGYFPMPHPETGEILWFRPDPRAILPLDGFHCSRSLARTLRRGDYHVTFDTAFREVMLACADRDDTWITPEFVHGYCGLHSEDSAHSVEVWREDSLVGGVYGVSLGGAFFAESMFHRETDMSKVALYHLVQHLKEKGFTLLEVQFLTEHLTSLGAIEVTDDKYQSLLARALLISASF